MKPRYHKPACKEFLNLLNKAVEESDLLLPYGWIRGFKNHGNMIEPWVVHNKFKGFKPQGSFSDALVSVHPASKGFFRIVQVHGFQKAYTHKVVKLMEGIFKCIGGLDIVPGAIGVAGIQTDPDSAFILDIVNNPGQEIGRASCRERV